MTLPIVTVVRTDENHSVISQDVTVAYYLPVEHQAQPPQPYDNEIVIEVWPAATVYTRFVENTIKITTFTNFLPNVQVSEMAISWFKDSHLVIFPPMQCNSSEICGVVLMQ